MKVYIHAKERGFVVATPNVTVAEWWRGRTDRREAVWRGLLVEPASDETMKLAGVALGKVRGATTVDAIVAAFAVQRTGIVYTGDVDDFRVLRLLSSASGFRDLIVTRCGSGLRLPDTFPTRSVPGGAIDKM